MRKLVSTYDGHRQCLRDRFQKSGLEGFADYEVIELLLYHPDWVAVQQTDDGEVHWITETKGRVWSDTVTKDEAMTSWCARVSKAAGTAWRYHRVNQRDFEQRAGDVLADVVAIPGLISHEDAT